MNNQLKKGKENLHKKIKMRRYISPTLLRTYAAQQQRKRQTFLTTHASSSSSFFFTRHKSSAVAPSVAPSSYDTDTNENLIKKMLKRDDFFALPDFVAKCNDNNTQINVQKVVKSLRENSITHPRDLLRLSKEDLLETVGVDKKDLARALREKLGVWTEEDEKETQREERESNEGERDERNGERWKDIRKKEGG